MDRDVAAGRHRLTDIAQGLETSASLIELLGSADACVKFLEGVTVEFVDVDGYMWVDNGDGALHACLPYWRDGDELGLWLDLCHELVHVKQHADGRDLYDPTHHYVDRPTELEAYGVTVKEGRIQGMSDPALSDFLHVPWITDEEHERLCTTLGVGYTRYAGE